MRQLSEIDDNFTKAWAAYQPNAGYYAMLMLVLSLISIAAFLVIGIILGIASVPTIISFFHWITALNNNQAANTPGIGHFIWIGSAFVLLILANGFIKAWQNAAIWMAFSAPAKIKISQILKQSIALTPRYFGLGILKGLIVAGGTILFIIPGILFSGWFTFSGIAAQKNSIMDSLRISRKLVTNRWWAIVLRLALGVIIALIVPQMFSSFVSGILSSGSDGRGIGAAIGILFALAVGIFETFFLIQWYNAYKYFVYLDAVESLEPTPSELPEVQQAQ